MSEVASEMWHNKTEELGPETLDLIVDVFINKQKIVNPNDVVQIKNRLPQHGALIPGRAARTIRFDHEAMFYYFLSHAIYNQLRSQNAPALLGERDVNDLVMDFLSCKMKGLSEDDKSHILIKMLGIAGQSKPGTYMLVNSAKIIITLLRNRDGGPLELKGLPFPSNALTGASFVNIRFDGCYFGDMVLNGVTRIEKCVFDNCDFERIAFDEGGGPVLRSAVIRKDSQVRVVEDGGGLRYYNPDEIWSFLVSKGFGVAGVEVVKPIKVDDELRVVSKVLALFPRFGSSISINLIEKKLGGRDFNAFQKIEGSLKKAGVIAAARDPRHYKPALNLTDIEKVMGASKGNFKEFMVKIRQL
jgi:hypothetical protein